MSVYVDPIFSTRVSGRWPYCGACHMIADSRQELIEFGLKLGLKSSWIQVIPFPHFDLTKRKRDEAIENGAIELQHSELIKKIRDLRQVPEYANNAIAKDANKEAEQ